LRKALAWQKDPAISLLHQAMLHQHDGRRDDALAALQRAVSLTPRRARVLQHVMGMIPETHRSAWDESAGMPDASDPTSIHLRRALGGIMDSLTWIIERFTPVLLVAAARRLGPHLRRLYEPEDVVNEVWVAVLPRLVDLEPREGRLTPVLLRFLATSLVSHINNLARRYGRREGRIRQVASSGAFGADLSAHITGVVTRVARQEACQSLHRILEELPEEDREIIILRAIEQNPNIEAARRLGLAPGTAAVRFHRALNRLRERIKGSIFDEIVAD
jgi:RNA polymerase sigma-70 factor (ECF subfamily)